MAKPEWGTKRICQSCGARFYDFGRSPIVCPTCSAVFDLEVLNRARRARPGMRSAVIEAASGSAPEGAELETENEVEEVDEEAAVEEEDTIIETEDGEEDDSLIEDASELGDDEDMSDVIEGGMDEETR